MRLLVMALKTRFNLHKKGFSIIEITIVVAIMLILFSVLVLKLNPLEHLKRGRDNKRISDLALIDRMIIEFKVDTGAYPDEEGTLRLSNVLPTGASSLSSSTNGWISQNLSGYNSRLPLDPLNADPYVYKYIHQSDTYELSTTLETESEVGSTDGGNDDASYELGNGLTLILP